MKSCNIRTHTDSVLSNCFSARFYKGWGRKVYGWRWRNILAGLRIPGYSFPGSGSDPPKSIRICPFKFAHNFFSFSQGQLIRIILNYICSQQFFLWFLNMNVQTESGSVYNPNLPQVFGSTSLIPDSTVGQQSED